MPGTRDFLLEIGVEEIPTPHLQPACDFIHESFLSLMRESGLQHAALQVSSTPRRFFLLARAVQEMQEDKRIVRTGPAKKIAFDDSGNLLPAALGFLKKNSAQASDIYIETTDKGEFIAVSYVTPGKATKEILSDWIVNHIPRIPFAKAMVWNESRLAFSRPVRWLCALWGEELIPVEAAGVRSDRNTFGNRYLGLKQPLRITSPADYCRVLQDNAVLADRDMRRARICSELENALAGSKLRVMPDERLIDTVTDLVEYPTAVMARFDPEFLCLPEKIITSTISQNQKYFSVQQEDGSLSNTFVFISNGDPKHSPLIRKGNEKVVAARLADALWYFQEDTKHSLESYLPRLEEVVFQSKLGTMAAKSSRVVGIVAHLCKELKLNTQDAGLALRAAKLCKADLVTTMLGEKEFTKLQGYIGKQYALACGEPQEVADGIYEHYMPRGTNDGLPQSQTGALVAVADKLDSVCGIIGIGLLPTGSADPFALRRAANGVVQIIFERGWSLDLSLLINFALDLVARQTTLSSTSGADVQAFFLQRVEWLLKQLNIDYDVIDSLRHLGLGDLNQLIKCARALQDFRTHKDFRRLVIGFKRVANIIAAESAFQSVSPELLAEPAEKELHAELQNLRRQISEKLDSSEFTGAIAALVEYGAVIDRFFDAVLVNCDDPRLRINRYALLNDIRSEFLRVADISRIVLENEENGD